MIIHGGDTNVSGMKPYGEDDMNNFAYDNEDKEDKSDDELLDEWETEGPEDKETRIVPEDAAAEESGGTEEATPEDEDR